MLVHSGLFNSNVRSTLHFQKSSTTKTMVTAPRVSVKELPLSLKFGCTLCLCSSLAILQKTLVLIQTAAIMHYARRQMNPLPSASPPPPTPTRFCACPQVDFRILCISQTATASTRQAGPSLTPWRGFVVSACTLRDAQLRRRYNMSAAPRLQCPLPLLKWLENKLLLRSRKK